MSDPVRIADLVCQYDTATIDFIRRHAYHGPADDPYLDSQERLDELLALYALEKRGGAQS